MSCLRERQAELWEKSTVRTLQEQEALAIAPGPIFGHQTRTFVSASRSASARQMPTVTGSSAGIVTRTARIGTGACRMRRPEREQPEHEVRGVGANAAQGAPESAHP